MKWKKKGNEFDELYANLKKLDGFYLFGAGHDGAMVYHIIKNRYHTRLYGFIDNDLSKQGKKYFDLEVYSLDKIKERKNIGIIISFSSEYICKIEEQLMTDGWRKGVNYVHYEEFLSVIAAYEYQELFLPSISLLPSTKCNLRCEACLNFTTYIKQFTERSWEEVKSDVDLFFKNVDYIGLFFISGGEPLLYSKIAELIRYIDQNYKDKIYSLETVTNGTVIPSSAFLKTLQECEIKITVDDYREELPEYQKKFEETVKLLLQYGGKDRVFIRKYEEWIALYPYTQEKMTEEELERKYNRCHVPWQEFRNGKLYSCNYASFAAIAGITEEPDETEQYDFSVYTKEHLKEAIEFRLGYSTKGYVEFCKQCAGYLEMNQNKVKPAKQKKGD